MENDLQLNELGVPGFIWLNIKALDNKQSEAIFSSFKEFAAVECKNDYTLALNKLLEYYQADAKTEMLWEAITRVDGRLGTVERKLQEPVKDKEPEPDTF